MTTDPHRLRAGLGLAAAWLATTAACVEESTGAIVGDGCPAREPACDLRTTPLTTDLTAGLVGLVVYESDVLVEGCEPECLALDVAVALVPGDGTETSAADLREAVNAATNPWILESGMFERTPAAGDYVFCIELPDADTAAAACAPLRFDAESLYSALLFTQFGPETLYLFDADTGEQIEGQYVAF